MPADTFVRRARAGDVSRIAAVQARAFRRAYADLLTADTAARLTADAFAGAWDAELAASSGAVFVAVDDAEVVGAAALRRDPDGAELATLVVDPDRQRHGHGSRLLAAVTDTLRADGEATLRVWCPAVDTARLRFLTSAGLRPDGSRRVLHNADGGEIVEIRLRAVLG